MILHAKQRQIFVPHAFIGVVVQIDMRNLHVARRQRFGIDAEPMILRGNLHLASQQILHRMI